MYNGYYNGVIRKYLTNFGRMFNDITVVRFDKNNNPIQSIKVPIEYGPKEKYLVRMRDDPDLGKQVSIKLPRLSFELTSIEHDPERGLSRSIKHKGESSAPSSKAAQYVPTPYNLGIVLYGMFDNTEDAVQVVEQILPYFRPDWTYNMKLVDGMDIYYDIPYVLDATTLEDTYENDFLTRRAIIYTFTFTIKGYLFGPISNRGIIKRAISDVTIPPPGIKMGTTDHGPQKKVVVTPGLTLDGEPTTDPLLTVPYQQIRSDDDWDFVVESFEYTDGIERHDH